VYPARSTLADQLAILGLVHQQLARTQRIGYTCVDASGKAVMCAPIRNSFRIAHDDVAFLQLHAGPARIALTSHPIPSSANPRLRSKRSSMK